MRRLLVLVAVLAGALPAADTAPADGIAERIRDASLRWFDAALDDARIAELSAAGEAIARRLEAGGTLRLAGDAGFRDEFDGRAGGFAAASIWREEQRLGADDAVLLGVRSANGAGDRCPLLAWAASDPNRFHGAALIAIGADWPLLARVGEAAPRGPLAKGWLRLDTRADAAVAPLATVATAWAALGEAFAAASREGRVMAMLASIFAPDGEAFDARLGGRPWAAGFSVAPIAPGTIARAYLATCREQIARTFAGDAPTRIRRAAGRIAACQRRGGAVLLIAGGHLFFRGLAVPPALTAVMPYGRSWEWKPPDALRAGDTLLWLGYLAYPAAEVAAARAAGADAVVVSVDPPPSADDGVDALAAGWRAWDAAVPIAGYPHAILPSSGVVVAPLADALLAEAAAQATR